MKRAYVIILASVMFIAPTLSGCSTETTTGVDVETTENEVDGRMNNGAEGDTTKENISPLDTAKTQ